MKPLPTTLDLLNPSGLTLITGERGSGKSLLLHALMESIPALDPYLYIDLEQERWLPSKENLGCVVDAVQSMDEILEFLSLTPANAPVFINGFQNLINPSGPSLKKCLEVLREEARRLHLRPMVVAWCTRKPPFSVVPISRSEQDEDDINFLADGFLFHLPPRALKGPAC